MQLHEKQMHVKIDIMHVRVKYINICEDNQKQPVKGIHPSQDLQVNPLSPSSLGLVWVSGNISDGDGEAEIPVGHILSHSSTQSHEGGIGNGCGRARGDAEGSRFAILEENGLVVVVWLPRG